MSRKLYNLQIKWNVLSEMDDGVGGGGVGSQNFPNDWHYMTVLCCICMWDFPVLGGNFPRKPIIVVDDITWDNISWKTLSCEIASTPKTLE